MPVKPKLVIVDTNCYVRLYCSPVRPILGSVVAGYKLVTLTELKFEVSLNTAVIERNPWMSAADIQAELTAACLKLRKPKTTTISTLAKHCRLVGDALLRKYCLAQNTKKIRTLSIVDARALAAADVLGAGLATDEWPLTYVAGTILGGPGGVQLFTSVGLLHLMEKVGSLSSEQRLETIRAWCLTGELLPRNWQDEYRALFDAEPPDGQSASSHSA